MLLETRLPTAQETVKLLAHRDRLDRLNDTHSNQHVYYMIFYCR